LLLTELTLLGTLSRNDIAQLENMWEVKHTISLCELGLDSCGYCREATVHAVLQTYYLVPYAQQHHRAGCRLQAVKADMSGLQKLPTHAVKHAANIVSYMVTVHHADVI